MKLRNLSVLFLVSIFIASAAFAAPEPALVQQRGSWTLDVTYEHPQLITVATPSEKARNYWYIILTLTNNTGKDIEFFPECELYTDTFELIQAGKGVPQDVFAKIKARHGIKYPLLESFEFVDRKILEGSDNSKDIAIIWSDFDPKAKNISFFISGLSNELAVVELPVTDNQDCLPKKVYLTKTLELSYSTPGELDKAPKSSLIFKEKKWVMR